MFEEKVSDQIECSEDGSRPWNSWPDWSWFSPNNINVLFSNCVFFRERWTNSLHCPNNSSTHFDAPRSRTDVHRLYPPHFIVFNGLESRLRLRFEMKTHSMDKSKTKPTFALFKMWRAISLYLILHALMGVRPRRRAYRRSKGVILIQYYMKCIDNKFMIRVGFKPGTSSTIQTRKLLSNQLMLISLVPITNDYEVVQVETPCATLC